MQTFLPQKNFHESASALDSKRLNKQILECYQILNVLNNPDPRAGWRNHPAVKMWRGHEQALFNYAMAMVGEANRRGIKTDKNLANLNALHVATSSSWGKTLPGWYSDPVVMARVTTTHRANLYRKDDAYYNKYMASVTDVNNEPCCERCNYYWVTHVSKSA